MPWAKTRPLLYILNRRILIKLVVQQNIFLNVIEGMLLGYIITKMKFKTHVFILFETTDEIEGRQKLITAVIIALNLLSKRIVY